MEIRSESNNGAPRFQISAISSRIGGISCKQSLSELEYVFF